MLEDWKNGKRIGIFGKGEETVFVLHGGPGAPGGAEPIAKELSTEFRVYSPWQRRSGPVKLSVKQHVEDLRECIEDRCRNNQPALVGESWGAMLALAFTAEYPGMVRRVALVGCGTFDEAARAELTVKRRERIKAHIEAHPEFRDDLQLPFEQQVMKWHEVTDTYCALENTLHDESTEAFDRQGFDETWGDMLRCQRDNIYPERFVNITSPVLMLHGDYDPHPGLATAKYLRLFIPHLEYREFEKCGHAPHKEKYAKDDFFGFLKSWLK